MGGKTGVNHPLGKNMIGAFYQPTCVLADMSTLSTLPDRELASGISEVVKYGLIRDAPFFEWLEGNVEALLARDSGAFAYAIERSCVNKAEVVAEDEREGGVRATLNLGHTFGHAIETATGYGEWLHGEAVSAGMVMAAWMSERLGWIDESLFQRTFALLEKCRTPVTPPETMTVEDFRSIMAVDKKVSSGWCAGVCRTSLPHAQLVYLVTFACAACVGRQAGGPDLFAAYLTWLAARGLQVLDGKLRLILLKGPLGSCVVTGDFDPKVFEETLEHFTAKRS